jgi:hypothetical protein
MQILDHAILGHFNLLCKCALSGADKGLQVLILFNASLCIMLNATHTPISNVEDLQ